MTERRIKFIKQQITRFFAELDFDLNTGTNNLALHRSTQIQMLLKELDILASK